MNRLLPDTIQLQNIVLPNHKIDCLLIIVPGEVRSICGSPEPADVVWTCLHGDERQIKKSVSVLYHDRFRGSSITIIALEHDREVGQQLESYLVVSSWHWSVLYI